MGFSRSALKCTRRGIGFALIYILTLNERKTTYFNADCNASNADCSQGDSGNLAPVDRAQGPTLGPDLGQGDGVAAMLVTADDDGR